jgi:hypothetical protein
MQKHFSGRASQNNVSDCSSGLQLSGRAGEQRRVALAACCQWVLCFLRKTTGGLAASATRLQASLPLFNSKALGYLNMGKKYESRGFAGWNTLPSPFAKLLLNTVLDT